MILFLSLILTAIPNRLDSEDLTISKIAIQGNTQFTDEEIIRILGMKQGDAFSYEKLNSRLQNILELYFEKSFYLVSIPTPQVIPTETGKGIAIVITINEAERLLISNIAFTGNKYFSDEKLRSVIPLKMGSPFDIQRSNATLRTISELYSEKGYPFCKVILDSIRIENTSLFLSYTIHENELVRISDIIFEGNTITTEKTLTLLMNFDENGIYNSRKIERVKQNLLHKRYIETVEIIPLNSWQILVKIKEKSMNHFQGILGLASSKQDLSFAERLTGFIDFIFLNILGTDREVQLTWNKLTSRSSEFFISYREPFILAKQISAEGSLRRKTVDTLYVNTNFRIASYFTMKSYNTIGLEYTYSTSLEDTISTERNGVGVSYEVNKLDYPLNPRKGFRTATQYSIQWHSKKSYDQRFAEIFEVLVPLNFYNVFSFKALAKFIFTTNDTISTYEKYSFGGYGSLRGFVDNQFISSIYGILSLEYRYLLSRDSRAFIFADYGYCKEHKNLLGVGLGVRLRSRIGIIKIDYGIGYQDGTWTNPLQGTIHFGLETGF